MEYTDIVNLIPADRPINRWDLKEMAGTTDRECRRLIQEAREHGELIINLQDGKGYKRVTADDIDDIRSQYWATKARMISLSKQQKYLRKILKESGEEV